LAGAGTVVVVVDVLVEVVDGGRTVVVVLGGRTVVVVVLGAAAGRRVVGGAVVPMAASTAEAAFGTVVRAVVVGVELAVAWEGTVVDGEIVGTVTVLPDWPAAATTPPPEWSFRFWSAPADTPAMARTAAMTHTSQRAALGASRAPWFTGVPSIPRLTTPLSEYRHLGRRT